MAGRSRGADLVVALGFAVAALGCLGVAGRALANSRGGASAAQLLVYSVVPAACGAGLLCALRLSAATRANLLLTLLSSAATLYAADLALGYHLERSDVGRRSVEAAEGDWDDRTRIGVALDLRRAGENAYPRLSGWDLRQIHLDLGGRVVQPLAPSVAGAVVVLCRETGRYVTYTADEHGFNNASGAWTRAIEAVIIGDSYVHGYCVPEAESLAPLLRRRWPTLLNLGVAGTGPLMQLAVLKEYAATKRPPTVIWVYYEGNDLSDLEAEAAIAVLREYLRPGYSQGLLRDQAALDAQLASRIADLVDRHGRDARGFSGGKRLATRAREALSLHVLRNLVGIGARFPRAGSELGDFPAILAEAKREVESWGGRLHLVYLPTAGRYRSWLGNPVRGRREVLGIAADLGVPVIDLEPSFRADPLRRSLWVPGGHLDPRGYARVAEGIVAGVPD